MASWGGRAPAGSSLSRHSSSPLDPQESAINASHASTEQRPRRVRKRWSTRRRVVAIVIIVVISLIVAVACIAAWVAYQAVQAKDSLEKAQTSVSDIQTNLAALKVGELSTSAESFASNVADAKSHTNDPFYRLAENAPMVGSNLTAVRQLTDSLNTLSTQALLPIVDFSKTLTPEVLKPVDGKLNVDVLRQGGTVLQQADAAIASTTTGLQAIDTTDTIGQVGSAKTTMLSALGKAHDQIATVQGTLTTAEGILGMNGPRHYLLAFLNNAETTGLGGGPASISMLTVDNGSFAITDQASSADFPVAKSPVRDIDKNISNIFAPGVVSTLNWSTSRPDFPTAALTIKAFWNTYKSPEAVDGVISVDPIALANVLGATGPVTIPGSNGMPDDQITADNAVSLLLHDVYLRYPQSEIGAETDQFFANAAKSIFSSLVSTHADPTKLLAAVEKSINSGDLMAWSANADEAALLKGTALEGVLPTGNAKQTLVGAFFRDVTVSKSDYYLETSVNLSTDVCTNPSAPTFTETITLHSTMTEDEAVSLPRYVVGQYKGQRMSTEVYGYGPVGADITSTTVGDSSVGGSSRSSADDLDRPVGRALVDLAPGETNTVTFTYKGKNGDYGKLAMQTTPMINTTAVTIDAPGCK